MSENKLIDAVRNLSDEQLAEVAGGNCTPEQITEAINSLQDSYETLIGFASYVIERVSN